MRIICAFIVLFFVTISTAHSQIPLEFEADAYNCQFTGKFQFETPLVPLERTRVNFDLVVKEDEKGNHNWQIRLSEGGSSFDDIVLEADTPYVWIGPHKKGDNFSGHFFITPLSSGAKCLKLGVKPDFGYSSSNPLYISWCMDLNGDVSYLGSLSIPAINCLSVRSFFFEKDSIVLPPGMIAKGINFFDYTIVISPIPIIDSVFNVDIRLESIKYLPENIGLSLGFRGFDVLNYHTTVLGGMIPGDSAVIHLELRPQKLRLAPRITLTFSTSDLEQGYQQIIVRSMFKDDGNLLGISDRNGLGNHELLPKTFPFYDKNDYRPSIKIIDPNN